MAKHKEPFRLLSDEEFQKLSQQKKIEYLSRAIEAVALGNASPIVGFSITPPKEPKKK